ncbi:serine/threonine-protein phosphatase 7 long form homolog [Arachis ipaensis]|uniref:serine/threonine-protein phosphatase 7 long form homolog n=1 Tax=Arachis ipaensis TaxID=130454 RepID=UPI000A2B7FA0|nr:serine/threonine-protein phosphatase 7 long form homolog [Arachis ipaensis]
MCRVANRNVTNLAGQLQLLQSWIFWRFPSLRPAGFEVFSFPLASRWSAYLPPNDGKEQRVIRYRLALDRLTARDIVWEPYSALDVLAVVHPEILTEEHSRMWRAVTALIYFAVIEWHQVDRVVPQLGGVQHTPECAVDAYQRLTVAESLNTRRKRPEHPMKENSILVNLVTHPNRGRLQ